jgi:hypothetical protein
MPPGVGGDIVRQGPEGFCEFRICRSSRHGHDRNVHAQIGHLAADEDELLDVARRVEPIWVARLDLCQRIRKVHRSLGVEPVEHDFEAAILDSGVILALLIVDGL